MAQKQNEASKEQNEAIDSGAQHVEETEHLAAGLEDTSSPDTHEPIEEGPVATELKDVTLSMFQAGDQIRVRVGSPYNPASSYEGVFESAEEANGALLDAGVLEAEQVPNHAEMLGTGILVSTTTAEKLVEAGLKRHHTATM